MIEYVFAVLASFFGLALSAATIQNTVFARSLGVSRMISLLDSTTNTVIFGVLLTIVNILSGCFYYLLGHLVLVLLPNAYMPYIRPIAMILCMGVAFLIVFVLSVKFAPYEHLENAVTALPPATFNCTIIGTILISAISQFSIGNVVAFALGSSAGFVLAVLIVTEGQRKLQNSDIPLAFKGLPAALLLLSGLALAVYALSGHTYSF